jgi:hypothetical protein
MIERNAVMFLHYKMQVKRKFEYPPYSTFKKEVDWSKFFNSHRDRKWICSALKYFFERGSTNDKFKVALLNAWGEYNETHPDKIEFEQDGISLGEYWSNSIRILESEKSLIAGWILKAATRKQWELNLINFLKTFATRTTDIQEELRFDTELRGAIVANLAAYEILSLKKQLPELSYAFKDLKIALLQHSNSDATTRPY